mmetsp:Transcript_70725/g.165880  ORF Transcript_70725/g.165880 Transcript_70725/m.165880 type:complete len:431 (+) Transcript_70725:22-1314(+)
MSVSSPSHEDSRTEPRATEPVSAAAAKAADKAKRTGLDHRPDDGRNVPPAQLKLRVSHLEADVQDLRRRKEALEKENEALAAEVQRPDLESRIKELQGEVQQLRKQNDELEQEGEAMASRRQRLEEQLSESQAACARLEDECRQHTAERERRTELEKQQADVARSFAELQAVVAQLLPWLGELDTQRARLVQEKGAAEAMASSLRSELQRWRVLWGSDKSLAGSDTASRASSTGRASSPSRGWRYPGNRRATSAAGERKGDAWNRRPSPCRLRCRAERPDWAAAWPASKEPAAVPGASEVLAALSAELAKAAPTTSVGSQLPRFAAQLKELLTPVNLLLEATAGPGASKVLVALSAELAKAAPATSVGSQLQRFSAQLKELLTPVNLLLDATVTSKGGGPGEPRTKEAKEPKEVCTETERASEAEGFSGQ